MKLLDKLRDYILLTSNQQIAKYLSVLDQLPHHDQVRCRDDQGRAVTSGEWQALPDFLFRRKKTIDFVTR